MRERSSGSVRVFYPEFTRGQIVGRIQGAIVKLQKELPVTMVVLFGSYSKGNYTVASDVDVLIVYRGNERKDAYAACKKALNIPRLEPHVYSETEYESMKEVIERMIKGGVVCLDDFLAKSKDTI